MVSNGRWNKSHKVKSGTAGTWQAARAWPTTISALVCNATNCAAASNPLPPLQQVAPGAVVDWVLRSLVRLSLHGSGRWPLVERMNMATDQTECSDDHRKPLTSPVCGRTWPACCHARPNSKRLIQSKSKTTARPRTEDQTEHRNPHREMMADQSITPHPQGRASPATQTRLYS